MDEVFTMINNIFPKTVLFDLDGTLLPMNNDKFEHEYFKRLCATMPEIEPQDMIKYIWYGTKAVIVNDDPNVLNRDVFAKAFKEISGINFYENEYKYTKYYETDFQELKNICPITETSMLIVKTLKEKGYRIGIATNPIFPDVATFSRLRWIGLDPEDFPLVTTYHNSHFAKPNPNYYREVLDKMGSTVEDTIMIGNDVSEDGVAANSIGLRVILVNNCLLNKKDVPTDDFEICSLEELYEFVKELPNV